MLKKWLSACTVFGVGIVFAAADIDFKWDVSGRNVAEPVGVSTAFATFDSVIRAANGNAAPVATVRAAYRDEFESDEVAISTFQAGTWIFVR